MGGALICFAIFIGVYKKQELKKSKLFVKAVTLGILAQVFTAISVLMVKPIMGNHNVVSIALIRFGTGLFITLIYIYYTFMVCQLSEKPLMTDLVIGMLSLVHYWVLIYL